MYLSKPKHKKAKLSLCFSFNCAPRHEGVLGNWWYRSTHSWPRH